MLLLEPPAWAAEERRTLGEDYGEAFRRCFAEYDADSSRVVRALRFEARMTRVTEGELGYACIYSAADAAKSERMAGALEALADRIVAKETDACWAT